MSAGGQPIPHASATPTPGSSTAAATGDPALRPAFGVLLVPGELRGTVTDAATGGPISTASYTVLDMAGSTVASGTVDASGQYTVGTLLPGKYRVTFQAPAYAGADGHDATVVSNATAVADGMLSPLGGRVRGTVVELVTGQALPDVTVTLQQGSVTRTILTDQAGRYAFEDVLPEQASSLAAASPDYLTTTASAAQFTLAPGGEASHVLPLAVRPGSLSGTVTDVTTGLPLQSATVQVLGPYGEPAAISTTDSGGAYSVPDLVAGTYSLSVARAGYLGAAQTATVSPNTTTTSDAALAPLAGSLSGVVADLATGRPIAGAVVQLVDSTGAAVTETTADAQGQYAFAGLATQRYVAGATAPLYTTVASSAAQVAVDAGAATTQNLFLWPPPSATASLTGVASDLTTGQAIAHAAVQVFDASGALAAATTTDGRGGYFVALPAGTYAVAGWAAGYTTATTATVVVPPGVTATRDLPFVRLAGSLTGTVRDQVTGQPIPAALVEVDTPAGQARTAVTNAAGAFAFASLPPGVYRLRSSAAGYAAGPAASASATLPAGGAAAATMQLTPQLGSIAGVVADAVTGAPLPGATVQVLGRENVVLATITAGPDGGFDAGDLPPLVPYTVRFSAPAYAPRSEAASVALGRTTEVNAALMPALGAISGIVVDQANGQPVPSSVVILVGPTGQVVASTTADAAGGFVFLPPAPGPYVAQADAPSGGPAAGGYAAIPASSHPVVSLPDRETAVTLQLVQRSASLAGFVVDSGEARPLAGSTVTITRRDTGAVMVVTTGEDGAFSAGEVAAGAYLVTASLPGYWPGAGQVVVPPGHEGFVRLALAGDRHTVGGTVKDSAGRPVPGASVTLRCGAGDVAAGLADAGGNFVLPVPTFPAGSLAASAACTIVPAHPDYLPALPVPLVLPADGAAAGPVSLVLAGRPAAVRITTVDARTGRSIPFVDIAVQTVDDRALAAQAATDTTGLVVIGGLTPLNYHITAAKAGYATKQVDVYAPPNRIVEIRLRMSVALAGTVTDMATGEVIPYARITLYRQGDPTAPGTGLSRRAEGLLGAGSSTPPGDAVTARTLFSAPASPSSEDAAGPLDPSSDPATADQTLPGEVLARWTQAAATDEDAGLASPPRHAPNPELGADVTGQPAAPAQPGSATVVGTAVADAHGYFWFDLLDEGDYRAVAAAPGWLSIDESDDSGNLTVEGPLLIVPLKLARVAAPMASAPQLPRTGEGGLARGLR